jgi:putative serine protease PepD
MTTEETPGLDPAPSPPPEEPKRRIDPWTLVLGILGGALLGTGVTFAVLGFTGTLDEPAPATTLPPLPSLTVPPPTTAPLPIAERASAAAIAQRAVPSIVAVEMGEDTVESGGSAVVYGNDGYLITNHHVIEEGGAVTVVFADGARYPAQIVGSDPVTDIGVLHVERADLTPLEIGDPAALQVGQMAVAIGNPLALTGGPSVTEGIVSARDRWLEVEAGTVLYGLIQTDAPITHGSSGGALLDESARLIGITTAIAVSDIAAEGFGFAVPIDMAIGVADDLIEAGEVSHGVLGIRGGTHRVEQAGAEFPVGVLVDSLSPDSPYGSGGGQVNDVIVSLDGNPVDSLEELLAALRRRRAGDEVALVVERAESNLDLTVTLARLDS